MSVFHSETMDAAYRQCTTERALLQIQPPVHQPIWFLPTIEEIMLDVFVVTEATVVVPTFVALDSKSAICSATLRCLRKLWNGSILAAPDCKQTETYRKNEPNLFLRRPPG